MPSLRSPRQLVALALLLSAGLLAAACRSDRPQAAAPLPTALAASTATPTLILPTEPPFLTPTAGPTPAVDMAALVGDATLPAGVSPFTGLAVDDPALLERMPAAVKISNSPIARPQSGLSRADVVIEHLAEGDITRFTAIFHSQNAERIGSVRSARLIDLELPALFDAYLVYSGASGEVERMIAASDFADRTLSDERKDPAFYRLRTKRISYVIDDATKNSCQG
mgnify:CR=1 FL=1